MRAGQMCCWLNLKEEVGRRLPYHTQQSSVCISVLQPVFLYYSLYFCLYFSILQSYSLYCSLTVTDWRGVPDEMIASETFGNRFAQSLENTINHTHIGLAWNHQYWQWKKKNSRGEDPMSHILAYFSFQSPFLRNKLERDWKTQRIWLNTVESKVKLQNCKISDCSKEFFFIWIDFPHWASSRNFDHTKHVMQPATVGPYIPSMQVT